MYSFILLLWRYFCSNNSYGGINNIYLGSRKVLVPWCDREFEIFILSTWPLSFSFPNACSHITLLLLPALLQYTTLMDSKLCVTPICCQNSINNIVHMPNILVNIFGFDFPPSFMDSRNELLNRGRRMGPCPSGDLLRLSSHKLVWKRETYRPYIWGYLLFQSVRSWHG